MRPILFFSSLFINDISCQMKKIILFGTMVLLFVSLSSQERKYDITRTMPVKIKWVTGMPGDFSFRHKWEYEENIFRNKHGQLICDGYCPDGVEKMFDKKGRILKDSVKSFYKLVDTSHYYHTMSCDAWCYEWSGTDFMDVMRSGDSVFCNTHTNVSTHCILELDIAGDTCYPVIYLNSIVSTHTDSLGRIWGGKSWFYASSGFINIDRTLWSKGIMKATFSFSFEHKDNPQKPVYWKGKIYARIKEMDREKMQFLRGPH